MLLNLAFRNILRNRRRSLLTASAMAFSSAMLLLALGVSAGRLGDMLASATEQYHGHVVLSGRGYQPERDLYVHFRPDTVLSKLAPGGAAADPEVRGVSPRLRAFGLLSHDQTTLPVEALGVQPDAERMVTTLQDPLVRGRPFAAEGNGCLLGATLADRLGVQPGDTLAFVTRGADGSLGNDLLTLSGVFATGNERNDSALLLVPLPWLQQVAVLPGQVHELAVSVRQPLEAPVLAQTLQTEVGDGFAVQDWTAFLPEIRDAIVISHVSNGIIMAVFYLATALGIFNTFYMSVMERTHEFGVLMALGMSPWRVRRLILLETFLLGSFSVLLGLALGFGFNWYLQRVGIDLSGHISPISYGGGTILPRVHSVIEPLPQVLSGLALLLVCILSGFVPADLAARRVPVSAIRES